MPVPIQNPATFSDAMAIAIANGHIKNAYEIAKVYDRVMESGDVEKIRSLDFSAELMVCSNPFCFRCSFIQVVVYVLIVDG